MSLAQQPKEYDKEWEKVAAFEQEGLPKSALEVVETIFGRADKENNTAQVIKSLLYISKFMMTLEDEAQLNVVAQLKQQIKRHDFPTSNILENILANVLWQYAQQNRWRIYNRTNLNKKAAADDFRTWDIDTFFKEIDQHFQQSLANQLQLQLEDLAQYNSILHVQEDSKKYRPTLFDLLAHNALQFYKTDENTITQPSYKFEVDNPTFLVPAKQFVLQEFESKDSLSLQLKALHIYQDLLRFHLKDSNPAALVDANIQRLHFVRTKATKAVDPYEVVNTLKEEAGALSNKEIAARYDFERAKILDEFANQYQATKGAAHRWERKEAKQLCEQIINEFPSSLAAKKATVLINHIQRPTLSIKTERFLPIDKPARLLVDYRNHQRLTFTVYGISASQLERFNKLAKARGQNQFY